MSFLFKPRQFVVMDAQSSGPARNFKMRYITLLILLLFLTVGCFALGAWYTPFHKMQDIVPENIKLKRQNVEMQHKIADALTLNDLKDEQLNSLKEQISVQENEIINVTKQLHMYKSILDERKGTGIHVLESKVAWDKTKLGWSSLFVKGGSFPRYLVGEYKIFALDDEGNKVDLSKDVMSYRMESHLFLQRTFDWHETWKPSKLELVIYNSRRKEVLRKIILIEGK